MRDSVAVKRSAEPQGKSGADDIVRHFINSIDNAKRADQPYRNWALTACLPDDDARRRPGAPVRGAVARGRLRQARVAQRHAQVFRVENREQFPVCEASARRSRTSA